MIAGEPWFVGKDIALALDYSNTRDALAKHVDEDDKGVAKCDTLGGVQELTVINESGMYALIFGSRLKSAKEFKHWVTSEVLPVIRKTGAYNTEKKTSVFHAAQQQIQELTTNDEQILAYNRGIILGVFRYELETNSTLEIYDRLSAKGKEIVMKMLFGEVHHA